MDPAAVVRVRGALGCAVLATLALALAGATSYGLGANVTSPELRVDAKGNAEVTWRAGGVRHSFLIPKRGEGVKGKLANPDVLKRGAALPLALVVGTTPDGTNWALQRMAVSGWPASLDLGRWRGRPTELTLFTDGKQLRGRAVFQGRPVTGSRPTLGGRPRRIYVFVECFGGPGKRNGWKLMLRVPPKADGSFSIYLRSTWAGSKYRATVMGPNIGGTLAPDARTTISLAPRALRAYCGRQGPDPG